VKAGGYTSCRDVNRPFLRESLAPAEMFVLVVICPGRAILDAQASAPHLLLRLFEQSVEQCFNATEFRFDLLH
jgi:hypothetical protein